MREQLRSLLARIREALRANVVRNELDEEFQFHLEQEVAHNVSRGMSHADARREALVAFGGVERFREETRAARGFASLDAFVRDTRLAFRRLRRAPTYTIGAVATLAIVLGAASSIGALVYGVMLRPLPFLDADRLVSIPLATPGLGITSREHSAGTFVQLTERARTLASVGGYLENDGIAITDGETPERITGGIVTTNIFEILGTKPAAGRLFRTEDARVDSSGVLIAYELWQQRFGGDPRIADQYIELNRRRRRIVGVLPKDFAFPSHRVKVWYPERVEATTAGLSNRYLSVVARLAPGASVESAQHEVDALMSRLNERFPELSSDALNKAAIKATVLTMRDDTIAPVRSELILLALMVAALVLIGTANVATLSLLRAERARSEVALSRTLGATRGALMRRFVIEAVMVSMVGALASVPLSLIAVSRHFGFDSAQIPRLDEVHATPMLIIAPIVLAVMIGMLLGMVSAARAGSGDQTQSLRDGNRTTHSRGWKRAQSSLVATQIALALSLLLSAGLMGRSFLRLSSIDVGFKSASATTFSVRLPFTPYPTFQRTAAFHLGLVDALRALPGVDGAAAAMQFPATPQSLTSHPVIQSSEGDRSIRANVTANVVSPEFFSVMEIPMRSGRTFASGDLATATPGVVLSASLARHLYGDANPLGKFVRLVSNRAYPPYQIVGVSGDVYSDRIAEGPLHVLYFPLLRDFAEMSLDTARVPFMPAGMTYVVRSNQSTSALIPMFRRAVANIDPRVPMWNVRSLDSIVADASARMRLTMLLLAVAAAATLLLSAIGLYSVISYSVAGRSREFAVRLALGATPGVVIRTMFSEGGVVAAWGVVAGLIISFAGTRVMRSALYEVSATDASTYIAATMVVVCMAALSMLVPALRAGKSDPARALRNE